MTSTLRHLAVALLLLAAPDVVLAQGSAPAASQGGGGVPVTIATARKTDVPVLLRAIGTVQALQSVVIRARVDGTLDKVAFTEGQRVKPGDLLAQLDPRPYQAVLDQALAKKAADEAMLANAKLDLVRYTDLAQSAIASRQKLDLTRASVMQAEAQVRGDDATVAAAQLNLAFTRITSPIEGRVGLRLLDPGNYVRAADPNGSGLVQVAQLQPIALLFTLPQDSLREVQAAAKRGKLPVMAYSTDDRTLLSRGELLTMDSTIDTTTGTIKLKAVFANEDDGLWPGQFVNVRLQLAVQADAVTVPTAAVQRGASGLFAFVLRPDSTVAVQPVEVSSEDGTSSVIAKGIKPGDQVVVAGQSRLTAGTRVAATEQKPAG